MNLPSNLNWQLWSILQRIFAHDMACQRAFCKSKTNMKYELQSKFDKVTQVKKRNIINDDSQSKGCQVIMWKRNAIDNECKQAEEILQIAKTHTMYIKLTRLWWISL